MAAHTTLAIDVWIATAPKAYTVLVCNGVLWRGNRITDVDGIEHTSFPAAQAAALLAFKS
ncbi:MAG: hypothetical protein DWG81_02625 [Chloroflexi bacterium]|nr:hypothetical protein [Chloroflexota bacterium]